MKIETIDSYDDNSECIFIGKEIECACKEKCGNKLRCYHDLDNKDNVEFVIRRSHLNQEDKDGCHDNFVISKKDLKKLVKK